MFKSFLYRAAVVSFGVVLAHDLYAVNKNRTEKQGLSHNDGVQKPRAHRRMQTMTQPSARTALQRLGISLEDEFLGRQAQATIITLKTEGLAVPCELQKFADNFTNASARSPHDYCIADMTESKKKVAKLMTPFAIKKIRKEHTISKKKKLAITLSSMHKLNHILNQKS